MVNNMVYFGVTSTRLVARYHENCYILPTLFLQILIWCLVIYSQGKVRLFKVLREDFSHHLLLPPPPIKSIISHQLTKDLT